MNEIRQVDKMGRKYYSFVGIYTFTYAAIGMLVPLLGQYLQSIGFTGIQIGVVTASATAVGIVASPFWGHCSHHARDNTRVVPFLCLITTLIAISMIFMKEYGFFLLAYALFSFFQTPIMPLTDAMALEARAPFGAVRKWGAIGFAAGVFVAGQLADATNLGILFPLCAFGYATAGVIIVSLRRTGNRETEIQPVQSKKIRKNKNPGNYNVLFKNKKFMALLAAAFFICGTNVANNIYFGFLYKDVGGSIAGIGIAFLLMCGSEAPFMAWTERISNKFTMERVILISMILSALRYLWYSTGPAPELLIGTFFLQGMVNGIVLIEFVRYIAKLVEPAMIGMAMTLYQAVSSYCSSILCQLIGGAILEHYSGVQVYLFFSIYNVIGILLYLGFRLYR